MVWQLAAAAGLQGLGSILGGQSQSKAAKQAAAESAKAAAEARSTLGVGLAATQNLYAPQVDMGNDVLGRLGTMYGLGSAGTPDWNAYVAQNGDVRAIADIMSGAAQGSPDQMAFIKDYQTRGAPMGMSLGEYHASVVPGRTVPTTGGTAATGVYNDPTAPNGYAAPTYSAPAAWTAPAAYVAPEREQLAPLDVSQDAYEMSPDFLFQLEQGMKALNSGYAAKGLLESGAAMKGITKYGQDAAYEDYAKFRDYTTGQWNTNAQRSDRNFEFDSTFGRGVYQDDRNFSRGTYEDERDFGRSTFESDRTYNANRYDSYQDRLFDLAGIGQHATDQTAGAIDNYGARVSDIITGNGQTQAQSKIAQGNAQAGMISGVLGAGANVLGQLGSGYGSSTGRELRGLY